jgi:hypothetical protein
LKKCKKKQNMTHYLIKALIVIISCILIFDYIMDNSFAIYKFSLFRNRLYFMKLNTNDLYLVKGEMYQLKLRAINKRVTFSSTNFRVAGVSFHGRVIGYRPGKAYILAKVDKRVLKCKVHVLDLSRKNITLRTGASKKLYIKGIVGFAHWESANERVASVNRFGKVTAKKKGRTIIYAKIRGKTLKCIVRVK